MKTRNNVQKTILSTAAVIVSLVLISYTVTAQDFWKMVITNSSFSEIALAMADTHEKPKAHQVNAETWNEKLMPAVEEEPQLNVEEWMKETANFEDAQAFIEPATENSLKVEDWMMNEAHFGTGIEKEMPLMTEPWMFNEKLWTR